MSLMTWVIATLELNQLGHRSPQCPSISQRSKCKWGPGKFVCAHQKLYKRLSEQIPRQNMHKLVFIFFESSITLFSKPNKGTSALYLAPTYKVNLQNFSKQVFHVIFCVSWCIHIFVYTTFKCEVIQLPFICLFWRNLFGFLNSFFKSRNILTDFFWWIMKNIFKVTEVNRWQADKFTVLSPHSVNTGISEWTG